MNHTLRFLVLFLSIAICFPTALSAQEASDENDSVRPHVMETQSGDAVELGPLVENLANYEVIFLGEQHDNDSGHLFQLDVIKQLVKRGEDVVISTEQFERDVQGTLDDYLAGRIDEDVFLANSRPWGNYKEHYRPIIEFAKENNIPVLAGNIPRRLAGDVSMGRKIKFADRAFLPRTTTAPKNAYWELFQETMKDHAGAMGGDSDSGDSDNEDADGDDPMLLRFYAAQCMKDDAMAEAITDYLAKARHESKTVVHLCGHFHSDFGLGTAARVVQRMPLMRIAVVTMETIPENDDLDVKGIRSRGHFIFWTEPNQDSSDEEADEDN